MTSGSGQRYLKTAGEPEVRQWPGVYLAIVSSAADPAGKHRIRMRVPQVLGTAVTAWAVPLIPVPAPPAVGATVAAVFLGGDPDQPAWLGPVG